MLLKKQREKVIEIALRAKTDNLVPLTLGNFSLRDKESDLICITPSGMEYSSLKEEDIVVIDISGNIIDGNRKPSTETPMHCSIYKMRNDIYGIAHTHSTFATAWACCGMGIPIVVAELASHTGGTVECAPYKPMGTLELAESVTSTLKEKYIVLLENHGVLAVGIDLEIAYKNVLIAEEGAKVAFYAKQIGNMKTISEEECQRLKKLAIDKYGQK